MNLITPNSSILNVLNTVIKELVVKPDHRARMSIHNCATATKVECVSPSTHSDNFAPTRPDTGVGLLSVGMLMMLLGQIITAEILIRTKGLLILITTILA